MGSGQSQFATLKLRSLALVPSFGALTRPYELHSWQLHCKILPVAPRRSGQKLAAVPRLRLRRSLCERYQMERTDYQHQRLEGGQAFSHHSASYIKTTCNSG